jgi:hypothetical protein
MTPNESSGRMPGAAATRVATRRTVLIIWCVIVAGALSLTVVAAIFSPGIWPRVSDAGEVVAWVAFGMALAWLLVSRVLPSRIKPPGVPVENIAVARSLVATALNGGIALFAPLAWMVSGKMIAIVALAISLFGLLLALPSERRWQKLCRAVVAARGQDLVVGAEVSTPQPPLSRKMLGLLVGISAMAAAALVLVGNMFWTEEVLRKTASPVVRALLFLILALMMIGCALMEFVRASASSRRRWQRVYGVLLLVLAVFAGYFSVQFVRMV